MSYNRKKYLWLPYLSKIEDKNKEVNFIFKGGETNIEYKDIHSIMIYGSSCDLSVDFLEKCCFYKIPIVYHRRNLPRATFISSTITTDKNDLITKQIMFRNNDKKRTYLAKRLISAKFKSMNWLIPYKRDHLYGIFDIDKIRNIEAWQSKVYWKEYFNQLGIKNGKRRDDNNEVKKTLDAVSKFVAGVILRWILYHNLSPFHGFLHEPTDYPALVYDLMEPYRGFFDEIVFKTIKENQEKNLPSEKNLPIAIENIKKILEQKVYVHSTRQITTFQELLHGIVLSLRVYLLQETRKFIIPMPEKPNGGRPIKAGFKLYGHSAGITDFWSEAKSIAGNFNVIN